MKETKLKKKKKNSSGFDFETNEKRAGLDVTMNEEDVVAFKDKVEHYIVSYVTAVSV